nr:hypothetical protein [Ningiella sp. W23]
MQAVSDVSKNIIHIAHSTSAQEQAIKEVNLVVQRLTGLTQANSAITEETMAAARQMAEQATEMRVQLNYFNLKKSNNRINALSVILLAQRTFNLRNSMSHC